MPRKIYFASISLFLICTIIEAQSTVANPKRGTINVKKPTPNQKGYSSIKRIKKRLYFYKFRNNGKDYQVIFPEKYDADIYPMVFNNRGLGISDVEKRLTDNKPVQFDYDLYKQNIFCKKTKSQWAVLFSSTLGEMGSPGDFVWISHMTYMDKNDKTHFNEIPEFIVKRIN
jgi:hypothetical protein